MKTILLSIIATAMAVSGLSAELEARNLGLKVGTDGKSSYNGESVTQTRKLELDLSLWGKEPAPNLVVKWTIYGHTRKDRKLVVIESGEMKTSLEPGKAVALTTPMVTIKGAREHSKSSGRGRKKKSKKVPASGEQYYGYSVKVMSGSTLLAEAYSKPSLKDE
jgi:hypothetical protein